MFDRIKIAIIYIPIITTLLPILSLSSTSSIIFFSHALIHIYSSDKLPTVNDFPKNKLYITTRSLVHSVNQINPYQFVVNRLIAVWVWVVYSLGIFFFLYISILSPIIEKKTQGRGKNLGSLLLGLSYSYLDHL